MGAAGSEHPAQNPKKKPFSNGGGAESGAVPASPALSDPELARLIAAWSSLSPVVKRGILAMVEAAKGEKI